MVWERQNKRESHLERLLSLAKNNPFVSLLILVGSVVGAGATLVTNTSKAVRLFGASEHIAVIPGHFPSEPVTSPYDSYKIRLEPQNSQQKLQRITLFLPSRYPALNGLTVGSEPAFEGDVGQTLAEIDNLLEDRLPPASGLDYWECHDSLPVALAIDYLTSSGVPQTEKQLYAMDFTYRAQNQARTRQEGGEYQVRVFWVRVTNFRFLRLLGRSADLLSTVEGEMARKHFDVSQERFYRLLEKDGIPRRSPDCVFPICIQ